MKLLNTSGRLSPDVGGNEEQSEMTDYDSRRTGNRLLDTGSTPVWSTKKYRSYAGLLAFKN